MQYGQQRVQPRPDLGEELVAERKRQGGEPKTGALCTERAAGAGAHGAARAHHGNPRDHRAQSQALSLGAHGNVSATPRVPPSRCGGLLEGVAPSSPWELLFFDALWPKRSSLLQISAVPPTSPTPTRWAGPPLVPADVTPRGSSAGKPRTHSTRNNSQENANICSVTSPGRLFFFFPPFFLNAFCIGFAPPSHCRASAPSALIRVRPSELDPSPIFGENLQSKRGVQPARRSFQPPKYQNSASAQPVRMGWDGAVPWPPLSPLILF